MIRVVATITVVEGTLSSVLKQLSLVAESVRSERGCIEYEFYIDCNVDIPRGEPIDKNRITLIEAWDSIESLNEHLSMSHMLAYREKVKDYVTDVHLRILRPSNPKGVKN